MKLRLSFTSLVMLAVLGVGAYFLGKLSSQEMRYFHVYIISNYADTQRNAQLLALDNYFKKKHSPIEHYKLHFTYVSKAQTPVSIVQHLRSSSHLAAENPLFVKLDLPTANSKKALRSTIELALNGERRRDALRAIVPVLTLQSQDGVNLCHQLRDDIIYAVDNFGGIAFIVDADKLAVLKGCTK